MLRSKIAGIGYYVPENVVTNDDLAKVMGNLRSMDSRENGDKRKKIWQEVRRIYINDGN